MIKINQVFFILTARELSVHRKDLWAPTLVGPPRLYQGSGPSSCTTPQQLTMYAIIPKHEVHQNISFLLKIDWNNNNIKFYWNLVKCVGSNVILNLILLNVKKQPEHLRNVKCVLAKSNLTWENKMLLNVGKQ